MAMNNEDMNPQLSNEDKMPFVRRNYLYVLSGGGVAVAGCWLLQGGGREDPNVFNESVFGFRQITLAPIVVVAGFSFVIYAVLYRPRGQNNRG